MKQDERPHAPARYYVFSFFVVLALALVAFIPSSMVYRLRIFDAIGLPVWMAETVRVIILAATPVAVLSTGFMRIFAVSDKDHAFAMAWAAALEGIGCVLEIVAALVNGTDFWALVAQAVTLGGSIACVFGALVLTLTKNGFYHLNVADNQRLLDFNKKFNKLLNDALDSPEAKATMQQGVNIIIKSQTEQMAGTALDIGGVGDREKVKAYRNGHEDSDPNR